MCRKWKENGSPWPQGRPWTWTIVLTERQAAAAEAAGLVRLAPDAEFVLDMVPTPPLEAFRAATPDKKPTPDKIALPARANAR